MIHQLVYTPVDSETIVLLVDSLLLAVIVTAESGVSLLLATDCTGKLPNELYAIVHILYAMCVFFNNMLLKLSKKSLSITIMEFSSLILTCS